jgi:transposase-like protein
MSWTDEQKQQVIQMYKDADPTPETSTEIIKDIAEETDQSPNGIRMVLVQAGVYVKKEAAVPKGGDKATGEGTKRVSKESQIEALKAAIEKAGKEVDEDILSKLTGKAAAYFVSILS